MLCSGRRLVQCWDHLFTMVRGEAGAGRGSLFFGDPILAAVVAKAQACLCTLRHVFRRAEALSGWNHETLSQTDVFAIGFFLLGIITMPDPAFLSGRSEFCRSYSPRRDAVSSC